jgi:hypothetical protein
VIVPLRPAMRAALERAAMEKRLAQQAESDLLAGAVLNASDVDVARVTNWQLTPDGIVLTIAEGPPDA